jgi:hypothetical protein
METQAQKFARTSMCLMLIHPCFKDTKNRIIVMMALHFNTFPRPKEEFATYLLTVTAYLFLVANTPRLISGENLTALHVLYDTGTDPEVLDWVAILLKLADPKSSNDFWKNELKVRRHEIEQLLLDIFHDIPESTFNSTDRSTLRRPAKSTSRHASYLMEVAPDLTIAEVMFHGIKVHLHNPETPDSDAMPEYQFVLLEWFIGASDTPPLTIVPTFNKVVKKALYLITFLPGDVGKTLFVRATYTNTVGGKSLFTTNWVTETIR